MLRFWARTQVHILVTSHWPHPLRCLTPFVSIWLQLPQYCRLHDYYLVNWWWLDVGLVDRWEGGGGVNISFPRYHSYGQVMPVVNYLIACTLSPSLTPSLFPQSNYHQPTFPLQMQGFESPLRQPPQRNGDGAGVLQLWEQEHVPAQVHSGQGRLHCLAALLCPWLSAWKTWICESSTMFVVQYIYVMGMWCGKWMWLSWCKANWGEPFCPLLGALIDKVIHRIP